MEHTVPEPKDQRANLKRQGSKAGRPACFDKTIYERGSEGERTTNRLKNFPDRGHEVRLTGPRLPRQRPVAAIWLRLRPWPAGRNLAVRRSKTGGTAPPCAVTVLPIHVV